MEGTDFEVIKNINLYEILGFNSRNEFTPELAKKNYRKLALKYHPDKNKENNDKFEMIQLAYLILSSPEYKEKYEITYDANSQIKDFRDLKDTINNNTNIQQISTQEFKKKINDLNIKNNSIDIDILDQNSAKEKTLEILKERQEFEKKFKEIYKDTYNTLNGLSKNELNKKFNEIFDAKNELINNTPLISDQTDITVFNGNDSLCNYTALTTMSYDSMYSNNSLYEETFNINNVPKFIDDNKSLELKMKEYKQNSEDLILLAKKSNLSNINTAVYKN